MRPLLALALSLLAFVAGSATASQPTAASTTIVLQRTDDGGFLLTDRPLAGGVIERSWTARGTAPAIGPERGAGFEPAYAASRLPRHIDALWRAVDEDPERERIVRLVLERERLQRPLPRQASLRGSAGPGNR